MAQSISTIFRKIEEYESANIDLLSKLKQNKNTIEQLRANLEKIENENSLSVTDHAVLRYAERFMGIDTDKIRAEILDKSVVDQIVLLGSGKMQHKDGYAVVVKNGTVVTIHENEKK